MKHYLFLGDSITDCDHRYDTEGLGDGYVRAAAGWLGYAGGRSRITNLGEDGLTSAGLLRKIKETDLPRADVVSILIGINDLWMQRPRDPAAYAGYYRENIREILAHVRAAKPETILLMEPFVFDRYPESGNWKPFLTAMSEVLGEEAAENEDTHFLPLSDALAREAAILGDDALSSDGIHPEQAGHEVIAKAYVKMLRKINPQ